MAQAGARRSAPPVGVADSYAIHCPDIVEVVVEGRPDVSGKRTVNPEGRIELGGVEVRIEGENTREAARVIAEELELPAGRVQVRVLEYRSQQIYLSGRIVGLQRTIPYEGQETVAEALRRAGGVAPGAEPDNVYVLRARVAEGEQPELYHVNLQAIVEHHDPRTDLRLQPFDQIYIGDTKQWRMRKCFAPCLRPIYEALCRLWPAKWGKEAKGGREAPAARKSSAGALPGPERLPALP